MNNSQLDGCCILSENNWKTWKKRSHMFEGITEPSGQWGVTGTLKWGGGHQRAIGYFSRITWCVPRRMPMSLNMWGHTERTPGTKQKFKLQEEKKHPGNFFLSSSPECMCKVHFQGVIDELFLSTASKWMEIMLVAGTQVLAANQREVQNRDHIHRHSDNTYTLYMYFLEQTRKPYDWKDCTSCYCYPEKTGSRNRGAVCRKHQSLRLEAENNSLVSFF